MSDIDVIIKTLDQKLESLDKRLKDLRSRINPIEDEYNKILSSKEVLLGDQITFKPKSKQTNFNTSKEIINFITNNPGLIGSDIVKGLGDPGRTPSIYSTLGTLTSAKRIIKSEDRRYYPCSTVDEEGSNHADNAKMPAIS